MPKHYKRKKGIGLRICEYAIFSYISIELVVGVETSNGMVGSISSIKLLMFIHL